MTNKTGKIATSLPPRRPPNDGVQLLPEMMEVGAALALVRRPAPSAIEATLVSQHEVVMPGLLLKDGTTLVLGWDQLAPLRAIFDDWLQLLPDAGRSELA